MKSTIGSPRKSKNQYNRATALNSLRISNSVKVRKRKSADSANQSDRLKSFYRLVVTGKVGGPFPQHTAVNLMTLLRTQPSVSAIWLVGKNQPPSRVPVRPSVSQCPSSCLSGSGPGSSLSRGLHPLLFYCHFRLNLDSFLSVSRAELSPHPTATLE